MTTYRVTQPGEAPELFTTNKRQAAEYWIEASREYPDQADPPVELVVAELGIDAAGHHHIWTRGGYELSEVPAGPELGRLLAEEAEIERRTRPVDSVASEQQVAIKAGYLQQLRTLAASLPAGELTHNQVAAVHALDRALQGEPLGHVLPGAYERLSKEAGVAGRRATEAFLGQLSGTTEARARYSFLQGRKQGLDAAIDLLVGRRPSDALPGEEYPGCVD